MWATGPAHRMQESLSLPAFKRKQLRHEPYPSRPPPPLGTSFLPLSRTDTQSVFFVQSQDTFIQRRVQPTSTPTTPAVPFLFLSLSFPHTRLLFAALALPTDLISSPLRGCRRTNTQKKEKKKKTRPCYHDLLEMHLVVSSFSFQILVMPVLWNCWSRSSW